MGGVGLLMIIVALFLGYQLYNKPKEVQKGKVALLAKMVSVTRTILIYVHFHSFEQSFSKHFSQANKVKKWMGYDFVL